MAQILAKDGRAFEVLPCGEEKMGVLQVFYQLFEPKGIYQGIPPARSRDRRRWIDSLFSGWRNFLITDGDRVVGHIAVTLGDSAVQELIIFLHRDYRGRGIGTEALRHIQGLLHAERSGKLWLTVQNTNIPAIRCFRKVGFEFISPPLEPEREMVLDLEESG